MKKPFFTLLLLCIFQQAISQEFKKFQFGIHPGFVLLSDNSSGLILAFEPRYNMKNQFSVGFKAAIGTSISGIGMLIDEFRDGQNESIAFVKQLYSLNGNYYLWNKKLRPFVGLGIGWFANSYVTFEDQKIENVKGRTNLPGAIGFYPRIGFDYKHLNFIIDYNVVEVSDSFLELKLGYTIGGGRKEEVN